MKSTAVASLLALAPAVLCAPLPIVLWEGLDESLVVRPGHQQQQQQRPVDVFLLDDGEAAAQIAIDNRPVTPASGVDPTVALATPQPVATTYLLSLARHKTQQAAGRKKPEGGKFATAAVAQGTDLPRKVPGMPCYMHHRRHDSTDVLAISLVATFLLVIVIVETWEGVCERYVNQDREQLQTGEEEQKKTASGKIWVAGSLADAIAAYRARSFACAQGPIHLDFDEEPFDEKVPLSIQADEGFVDAPESAERL